jgi:sulfite reductase (NADPH) hemoprotein beta-component
LPRPSPIRRRPFSEDDNQFLKFHGSYQQDDRDLRKTGKKYIMMMRGRIPGGVMTPKQYGVFDDCSRRFTATTRCASPRARASSFTAS